MCNLFCTRSASCISRIGYLNELWHATWQIIARFFVDLMTTIKFLVQMHIRLHVYSLLQIIKFLKLVNELHMGLIGCKVCKPVVHFAPVSCVYC
jgi:hypothetical protein